MYCPVCFQDTLKVRSSGVIKLAFNGKSRNTSLFTYNLQKDSQEQLLAKLREKVVDFFGFYAEFNNKSPIKTFEAYSSDFQCSNSCKMSIQTNVSVIGVIYSVADVQRILAEEARRFGIDVKVSFN